ncbi:MAG: penicillin-binding protein 2 [Deltaproteobacteria bacterium]|nr:penicillin-binding protein 2 [Deltaproteobacteria bacterium]
MKQYRLDNQRTRQSHLWLVQVLVAGLFCLLSLRLWYLQVYKGEHFARKAQDNRIRRHTVYAPRGLVVDREGRFLAVNEPAYGLAIVRENCSDFKKTLDYVALVSGAPREVLVGDFEKGRKRVRSFEKQILLSNIPFSLLAKIEADAIHWPELQIVVQPRRHYTQSELFSHVIGYVAQANEDELNADPGLQLGDTVGKAGLELIMESRLRGSKGLKEEEVDAAGRCLNERVISSSEAGENFRLSIDLDLQKSAADRLKGQAGAVVVLEPRTGKVLALVSQPGYDSNLFVGGLSDAQWNALVSDPLHPLQNRPIQSAYPPGSVFKLVMAGCGMMNHFVSLSDQVYCTGVFKLGEREFRCWKKGGHGAVDLRKSLVESCDVYYYQLGKRMGIDTISTFTKACGFGAVTGIDLPSERPGLVPDRAWKVRRHGESWQGGDTINMSIGQGMLLTTPLQVARFVAALINGGHLIRPSVLADSEVEIAGQLPMNERTAAFIAETMVQTVELRQGTAWRLKRPGVRIGGKTGTAQVVRLMEKYEKKTTDEIPYKFRDHAWMASFAQQDDDSYVIVAMVEHGGGGGATAGPVVDAVYEHLFPRESQDDLNAVPTRESNPT